MEIKSEALAKILGAESVEVLRKGITEILLKQIKVDLENWDSFILYPPDFEEFTAEIIKECREEIKGMIKEKFMADAMEALKKFESAVI